MIHLPRVHALIGARLTPSLISCNRRIHSLPNDPPHPRSASSAGIPSHYRRGTLMPLYPTLGGQLGAIAREYGLPSIGGLAIYLVDDGEGNLGPCIGDAAWRMLWGRYFEEEEGGGAGGSSSRYTPSSPFLPIGIDAANTSGSSRLGGAAEHSFSFSTGASPMTATSSNGFDRGPIDVDALSSSEGHSQSGARPAPFGTPRAQRQALSGSVSSQHGHSQSRMTGTPMSNRGSPLPASPSAFSLGRLPIVGRVEWAVERPRAAWWDGWKEEADASVSMTSSASASTASRRSGGTGRRALHLTGSGSNSVTGTPQLGTPSSASLYARRKLDVTPLDQRLRQRTETPTSVSRSFQRATEVMTGPTSLVEDTPRSRGLHESTASIASAKSSAFSQGPHAREKSSSEEGEEAPGFHQRSTRLSSQVTTTDGYSQLIESAEEDEEDSSLGSTDAAHQNVRAIVRRSGGSWRTFDEVPETDEGMWQELQASRQAGGAFPKEAAYDELALRADQLGPHLTENGGAAQRATREGDVEEEDLLPKSDDFQEVLTLWASQSQEFGGAAAALQPTPAPALDSSSMQPPAPATALLRSPIHLQEGAFGGPAPQLGSLAPSDTPAGPVTPELGANPSSPGITRSISRSSSGSLSDSLHDMELALELLSPSPGNTPSSVSGKRHARFSTGTRSTGLSPRYFERRSLGARSPSNAGQRASEPYLSPRAARASTPIEARPVEASAAAPAADSQAGTVVAALLNEPDATQMSLDAAQAAKESRRPSSPDPVESPSTVVAELEPRAEAVVTPSAAEPQRSDEPDETVVATQRQSFRHSVQRSPPAFFASPEHDAAMLPKREPVVAPAPPVERDVATPTTAVPGPQSEADRHQSYTSSSDGRSVGFSDLLSTYNKGSEGNSSGQTSSASEQWPTIQSPGTPRATAKPPSPQATPVFRSSHAEDDAAAPVARSAELSSQPREVQAGLLHPERDDDMSTVLRTLRAHSLTDSSAVPTPQTRSGQASPALHLQSWAGGPSHVLAGPVDAPLQPLHPQPYFLHREDEEEEVVRDGREEPEESAAAMTRNVSEVWSQDGSMYSPDLHLAGQPTVEEADGSAHSEHEDADMHDGEFELVPSASTTNHSQHFADSQTRSAAQWESIASNQTSAPLFNGSHVAEHALGNGSTQPVSPHTVSSPRLPSPLRQDSEALPQSPTLQPASDPTEQSQVSESGSGHVKAPPPQQHQEMQYLAPEMARADSNGSGVSGGSHVGRPRLMSHDGSSIHSSEDFDGRLNEMLNYAAGLPSHSDMGDDADEGEEPTEELSELSDSFERGQASSGIADDEDEGETEEEEHRMEQHGQQHQPHYGLQQQQQQHRGLEEDQHLHHHEDEDFDAPLDVEEMTFVTRQAVRQALSDHPERTSMESSRSFGAGSNGIGSSGPRSPTSPVTMEAWPGLGSPGGGGSGVVTPHFSGGGGGSAGAVSAGYGGAAMARPGSNQRSASMDRVGSPLAGGYSPRGRSSSASASQIQAQSGNYAIAGGGIPSPWLAQNHPGYAAGASASGAGRPRSTASSSSNVSAGAGGAPRGISPSRRPSSGVINGPPPAVPPRSPARRFGDLPPSPNLVAASRVGAGYAPPLRGSSTSSLGHGYGAGASERYAANSYANYANGAAYGNPFGYRDSFGSPQPMSPLSMGFTLPWMTSEEHGAAAAAHRNSSVSSGGSGGQQQQPPHSSSSPMRAAAAANSNMVLTSSSASNSSLNSIGAGMWFGESMSNLHLTSTSSASASASNAHPAPPPPPPVNHHGSASSANARNGSSGSARGSRSSGSGSADGPPVAQVPAAMPGVGAGDKSANEAGTMISTGSGAATAGSGFKVMPRSSSLLSQ